MSAKRKENKPRMIILSIAIAVIVWIVIGIMQDPDIKTTASGLKVHYTGEDVLRSQGLVVADASSQPALSVVISGKRNDLIEYADGIYVNVDVSEITEAGEYSLPGSINLPSTRLSVEKERYKNIPVKVERLTRKNIPIVLKQTGTAKNGLVRSSAQRQTVSVLGAESEINKVAYGYVEIDVSKIEEDNVLESAYLLMDENDLPLSKNDTIESDTKTIEIVNTIYQKKTLNIVPRLDSSLTEEYYLDKLRTTLERTTAEVGVLDGYEFESVFVNITSPDSETAEFTLVEEEGMYIPDSAAKLKVKPEIKKLTAQRMDVTVEAQGLANGLAAEFNPVVSGVLAYGPEGASGGDNMKAYIDLSGKTVGTYQIPVVFESELLSVREPHFVSVTIKSVTH